MILLSNVIDAAKGALVKSKGEEIADSDKAVKLCSICKKRPRHVNGRGVVESYCIPCRRKRFRDKYRSNPVFRKKVRTAVKAKYHAKDGKYKEAMRKLSRDRRKNTEYFRSDKYRVSVIKCHMHRLAPAGFEDMVKLVDAEKKARTADGKKGGRDR